MNFTLYVTLYLRESLVCTCTFFCVVLFSCLNLGLVIGVVQTLYSFLVTHRSRRLAMFERSETAQLGWLSCALCVVRYMLRTRRIGDE